MTNDESNITSKEPFRYDGNEILFKDIIWIKTQDFSKEFLKRMVNSLNKAYQKGFSDCATLMLNKDNCPTCRGDGELYEGGMFSKKYKCETCNGKGKLKKK
jgi:DnaJ-class molecular chaperone